MADPVTIGGLAATALALASEAAVGEAVKDAYQALKNKIASWAGRDVEALEQAPASAARRAVVAEMVDVQPADDVAAVRELAERLIAALKTTGPVGLDIGRLEALEVQLGDISVAQGTGARIDEARAKTFKTGKITVGGPTGKT